MQQMNRRNPCQELSLVRLPLVLWERLLSRDTRVNCDADFKLQDAVRIGY